MKTFEDESVDMVMTSPPYWGHRDYGIEEQIGLEASPEEYIQKLAAYFLEVERILKHTGSLYINLGDTYSRKNLLMLPARVVLALQEEGWILRNDIIWFKPNHMPSSVKDRLTNTYEHLFHFVKSRKYYYHLDAIRIPHKTGPAQFNYRVREAKKRNLAIVGVKASPQEMHQYDSKGQRIRGLKTKSKAQIDREQHYGQDVNYHPNGGNPGDVASYNTKFDDRSQAKRLSHSLAYARKVLGREHETALNHPLGKNPGDVLEISAKDTSRHHGSVPPNLRHGEDMPSSPLGRNPGDVIETCNLKYKGQTNIRQNQNLGGNVGLAEFRDRCRANGLPEGHPAGTNPGDVVNLSPETRSKEKLLNRRRRDLDEMRKEGKIHWELHPSKDPKWFANSGKNPSDFWTITTRGFPEAHFAVYPEALCVRPILSSCPASGVVLDPFAGSGTTMAVAMDFGRNSLGIELNPRYVGIIKKRAPTTEIMFPFRTLSDSYNNT